MASIKMITRDADNFRLRDSSVVVQDWAHTSSFELREEVLLLDLQTRAHPDGLHYRTIAQRLLEVQKGIQPFLRAGGVIIGYLSNRGDVTARLGHREVKTGNHRILQKVGLGISWGGFQKYKCTSVVDRSEITRYVRLVHVSDCYIEFNNPEFDSITELIKRGEYGKVCGAVFEDFQDAGHGTLILLPRPQNLAVRPDEWFNQTMSVATPYLPDSVRKELRHQETPTHTSTEGELTNIGKILKILSRFHNIAQQLENRYSNRETLVIGDEYDVQDLVHALLWIHFDDIRDEEQSPSHGGSSSRIDFLVKDENIGIEIKLARSDNKERELKGELAEDKEHYQAHPNCEKLICFIYDPNLELQNPNGFEKDLSNPSGPLRTTVIVSPK